MGAGASSASSGDAAAIRQRELTAELKHEIRSLKQQLKDLEAAGAPAREAPPFGVLRLAPSSVAAIRRLFDVLDTTGDGLLSAEDIPAGQKEKDTVHGRVIRLLEPLSELWVSGEATPQDFQRAFAKRVLREVVSAGRGGESDAIAGWVSAVEREANNWVERQVCELLGEAPPASAAAAADGGGGSGGGSVSRAVTSFDEQPRIQCVALVGLALAFSNLGVLTNEDDLFGSASLPLETTLSSAMSLAEAYHVARCHVEARSAATHVAMLHAQAGRRARADFGAWVLELASATVQNDAVALLLLDASVAHGTTAELSVGIHCVALDSYDAVATTVTVVDTNPKAFSCRWSCSVEQLYEACLAARRDELPCGGVLALLRRPIVAAARLDETRQAGRYAYNMGMRGGLSDCFSAAAGAGAGSGGSAASSVLPRLSFLSPLDELPCTGLVSLSAALGALSEPMREAADVLKELSHELDVPLGMLLERDPSLAALHDIADKFCTQGKGEGRLHTSVSYCDTELSTLASFRALLEGYSDDDEGVCIIAFDGETLRARSEVAGELQTETEGESEEEQEQEVPAQDPRFVFLASVGEDGQVGVAECLLRHSSSSWRVPVEQLWKACSAQRTRVGRSGGCLHVSSGSGGARGGGARRHALGLHYSLFAQLKLPEFEHPLPATSLTAISFALRALVECNNKMVRSDKLKIREHMSVDEIIFSTELDVTVSLEDDMTVAQAYYIAARAVELKGLPVRVEAVHFDLMKEDWFGKIVDAACDGDKPELLILLFDLRVARGISSSGPQRGHVGVVCGVDPMTRELEIADMNPRMYRQKWRCPQSAMFAACQAMIPSVGRSRGLLRMTLLTSTFDANAELETETAVELDSGNLQAADSEQAAARSPEPELQEKPVNTLTAEHDSETQTEKEHHALIRRQNPGGRWDRLAAALPVAGYSLDCPGLSAIALVVSASGYPTKQADIFRLADLPFWTASKQLPLAELAAIARTCVNQLHFPAKLAVQEFAVGPGTRNEQFDVWRRELERCKFEGQDGSEFHVFAFRPNVAHNSKVLTDQLHYCVLGEVRIQSQTVELVDLAPKVYFKRWSCPLRQMFDAISSPLVPGDVPLFGMLRISAKESAKCYNEMLYASEPSNVEDFDTSVDGNMSARATPITFSPAQEEEGRRRAAQIAEPMGLHAVHDGEEEAQRNHALDTLSRAFTHFDVELFQSDLSAAGCSLESFGNSESGISLDNLGDYAIKIVTAKELNLDVHVVHLDQGGDDLKQEMIRYTLEKMRKTGARSEEPCEVLVCQFSSAVLYGDAQHSLHEFDWAVLGRCNGDATYVRLTMFDGSETLVERHLLLKSMRAAQNSVPYAVRSMGLVRICLPDASPLKIEVAHIRSAPAGGKIAAAFAARRAAWRKLNAAEHGATLLSLGAVVPAAEPMQCTAILGLADAFEACLQMSVLEPDYSKSERAKKQRKIARPVTVHTIFSSTRVSISQAFGYTTRPAASKKKKEAAPKLVRRGSFSTTQSSNKLKSNATSIGSVALTMTLSEVDVVAKSFISKFGLPLAAEIAHFDRGTVSEEGFHTALTAVVAANANQLDGESSHELYLFFFNPNIAHNTSGLGDSHAASMVDYDPEARKLLLRDTLPSMFGLYWQCDLRSMYMACVKQSTGGRALGVLRICHDSSTSMELGKSKLDVVSATRPRSAAGIKSMAKFRKAGKAAVFSARLAIAIKNDANRPKMAALRRAPVPEMKQHLPCHGLVALVAAFNALGLKVSASSIFSACRLPLNAAVCANLSLGQISTIAQRYISERGLALCAEVVHFDSSTVTFSDFKAAMLEASRTTKEMVIFDFCADIAHARIGLGGGHFGLLAEADGELEKMTIADVDPGKFSEQWTAPILRMYSALCTKDPDTGRARGLLRLTDEMEFEPLAIGRPNGRVPPEPTRRAFRLLQPESFSLIPPHNQRIRSTNILSLAMAFSAIDERAHSVQDLFDRLSLPRRFALNGSMSLNESASLAAAYIRSADLPVSLHVLNCDVGAVSKDELAEELGRAAALMADDGAFSEAHILVLDANKVLDRFDLDGSKYLLFAGYREEGVDKTVYLADPECAKNVGVWSAPLAKVYAGLCAPTAHGRAHGLMRLAVKPQLTDAPPMLLRARDESFVSDRDGVLNTALLTGFQ